MEINRTDKEVIRMVESVEIQPVVTIELTEEEAHLLYAGLYKAISLADSPKLFTHLCDGLRKPW